MTAFAADAFAAEEFQTIAADVLPVPSPDIFDPRFGGALLWVADIEAALDGGTVPLGGPAHADDAFAAEPPIFAPAGGIETIRASDLGWRGPQPYPPVIASGPDIDRRVALAPAANDTYAWGSLRMTQPGVIPGVSLAGRDTALRRVRIRAGLRGYDRTRGIATDPNEAGMIDAFSGLAGTWQPREDGAEVPLRDPGAWLDTTIGVRRFLGTGGAEGPADLAGQPFPLVRGGSASAAVTDCPVVLVNAASRIYRWTDGAATLLAVKEDGAPVYTNAGAVADVFATSPSAGQFVWDNTGQFRLGSDPAGAITVDGHQGSSALLANVIRDLLTVTLGLPAGLLRADSIITTATLASYAGGWAYSGNETGREALQPLLAGLGARLVASRSGGLRLWPLRALPAGARPVAVFDAATALTITPVPLGQPLTPPAANWSVGYGRTHVTTTTPKPTVTTAERERLAQPWRTARWSDQSNVTRYAQASRPDLVGTALTGALDAQGLANALGALWGVPRQLWQVTAPASAVLLRDIGDVVELRWPADGLRLGALGQVVGDSIRAGQSTASLLVLV